MRLHLLRGLLLGLLLAGCGPVTEPAPSGERVQLLTNVNDCGPNWVEGVLVANSDHGTDIEVHFLQTTSSSAPDAVPSDDGSNITSVAWPSGFSGVRLTGGVVAVLDGAGKLVAKTGRKYRLKGGMAVNGPLGPDPMPPGLSGLAGFRACGDPQSVLPE